MVPIFSDRSIRANNHSWCNIDSSSSVIRGSSRINSLSSIAPPLFLLCGSHLSSAVKNSKIATFADDNKIIRTINSTTDASALQHNLTNFEQNSTNSNLAQSPTKCKVLRVTRKRDKIVYLYKLSDTT